MTTSTTAVDATDPGATAPAAPESVEHRALPSWALFAFVALGAAVTVLVHNRWLFSQGISAEGDFGLNGLLADQARHFTLWQGNYSRVGFHHPGPALLYVMMVGDVVAHSWLHVVPAATNGMIVGQVVFDAALLGTIALVVRRATGSVLGGVLVAALVLLPVVRIGGAADPWPPYQYLPAFALFVVAAVAVAAGVTRALTAYVVGAGLIAHGQVSFLLFVAVTTVVVAAGWWFAHRGEVRATLLDARGRVRTALAVLALFLLPLVLQAVFHHGGPWRSYVGYTTGDGAQHNPVGASIGWIGWYVTNSGVPMSVAVAAVVVLLVLAVTERDRARRLVQLSVVVIGAVQALLTLYYAMRGVDGLDPGNRYLEYFALTLAPIVAGLALVLLGVRAAAVLGRFTGARTGRWGVGLVAAAVVVGLLAYLVPDSQVESRYRGVAAIGTFADTIAKAPGRDGRSVSFRLDPGKTGAMFAYTAGVVFELQQQDVHACVWSSSADQQSQWEVQFTSPYTCNPSDLGGTYQLQVKLGTSHGGPAPANAVYHDGSVTVVPSSA